MTTTCTSEIDQLDAENVLNSQNSTTFQRPETLLVRCQESIDPFSEFCLYPPDDGRMVVMCQDPPSFNPSFLFSQMLENDFKFANQLPKVISYPDLKSNQDWVSTDLYPGADVQTFANGGTEFATSNDTRVSAAIILGTWYISHPVYTDGLLRPPSNVVLSQLSGFSSVGVNDDGTICMALFPTLGVYVWNANTNTVVQLSVPIPGETMTSFTSLVMYNTDLCAIGFVTNLAVYVRMFRISTLSSYKQVRLPINPGSTIAWCVLTTDLTQVFFGVITNNNIQTYTIVTDPNNPQLEVVGPELHVTGFLMPSNYLVRWFAILPANLSGPALFLTNDHVIFDAVLVNSPVDIPANANLSVNQFRLAQRTVNSVYVESLQGFFFNLQLQPVPPFPLSLKDVFSFTPDGNFVIVNAFADQGKWHRFNTSNKTWDIWDGSHDLFIGTANPAINELVLGHTEWFLGTTIATTGIINPIPSFPYDILLSRHSIVKLVAKSISVITGTSQLAIFAANVLQLVKPPNVVRLYDNAEIQIYSDTNILVWNSATNDQEGSDSFFAVLPLEDSNAIKARDVSRAVSSPNGRYMLLVYNNDRVDLVINPFNMPRFTASTEQTDNLTRAVRAQATFCIQALNGQERNSVEFVDKRCSCLTSQRLLERVYPKILSLSQQTQLKLSQDLPCVMNDCDLAEAEYSNAASFVGTRCILSTGVCSQHIDPSIQNLISVQDCTVNLNPCTTTANCPTGSNCRNGQCVAQCSSDTTCRAANPLARCIGGQCIEQAPNSQEESQGVSAFYIISIILAVILLILLILLVFFSAKK